MPLTGTGIFYQEAGRGFPLVMLHGATLEGCMWAHTVARFENDYRCITVDRRGHGRSEPLADGADPVKDLLSVLDHAGVDFGHIIGLSLGGFDAIALASQFPERVRSLILAGAWLPIPEMTWSPPVRIACEEGVEAARKAWLDDPLFASARQNPAVWVSVRAMMEANDFSLWTRRAKEANSQPPQPRDLASRIQVPTLITVGKLDLQPFHAVAQWLHGTIPGAASRPVVAVPEAGHLACMEQPEIFREIVSAFLSELA